jgi:outer membrane protein assembly factor BamB
MTEHWKRTRRLLPAFIVSLLMLTMSLGASSAAMSASETSPTPNPESAGAIPSPALRWAVDTEDIAQDWGTELRAGGESVYVTDRSGSLAAFNAQSGDLRWIYNPGLKVLNTVSPLVAGGLVLYAFAAEVQVEPNFIQQIAFVVAVDARTGVEKWRFQTDGNNVSAPTVGNDIVYFGTDAKDYNQYSRVPPAGYVYALRLSMGALLWKLPLSESHVGQSLAVADGALYFIDNSEISRSSVLHAISTSTHKEKWNLQVCAYGKGPTLANGILYVECSDHLQAISTQSGSCLWDLAIPSNPETFNGPATTAVTTSCPKVSEQTPTIPTTQPNATPTATPTVVPQLPTDIPGPGTGLDTQPLVADGTIYIGVVTNVDLFNTPADCPYTVDSYLLALDARTGREKWRFKTDDAIRSNLAMADGAIYFNTSPCFWVMGGADDDYVYAVDAKSGKLRWRFHHSLTEDGAIVGSFAPLNGSLYFATEDGKLFSLLTTLPGMPISGSRGDDLFYLVILGGLLLCLGATIYRWSRMRG